MLRRLLAMRPDALLASRAVSPLVIVALLAAEMTWLLLVFAWLFEAAWPRAIIRATSGLVSGTLISSIGSLAIPMAIVGLLGGLRFRDVGLTWRGVLVGLVATIACWLGAQVILAIAAGEIAAIPITTNAIGEELGQLFGNALNEEIMFRGVLFVQLVLIARRRMSAKPAWLVGALGAAIIFALTHLPNRWSNGELHGLALVQNLWFLTWNGLVLSIVYARTGSLAVAIGFHALWNEPLPIVHSPMNAGTAIMIVQVAIIVAWPVWRRDREARVPIRQS